jgi:replication initiation protein RepC
MRAQVETNEREDGKTIDKWKLFDALKRSKDLLGISDRALTVLNALLTFHRSDELSGEDPIIVFPSNKSLALRAHGMSETTLRTYLSSLVSLGLIIRHDSPNGKAMPGKGRGAR